jgi:hypothetical protein
MVHRKRKGTGNRGKEYGTGLRRQGKQQVEEEQRMGYRGHGNRRWVTELENRGLRTGEEDRGQ